MALELERRSKDHVRIIAGTKRSLLASVAAGTSNETLFYRLNVIHLGTEPPRQ